METTSLLTDSTNTILLGVIILCTLGVIVTGVFMLRLRASAAVRGRITDYVESGADQVDSGFKPASRVVLSKEELGRFRSWINRYLGVFSSEKLQVKISSAYWEITDTEFILIRIVATTLGLLLGWVITNNILGGMFLGGIALLVPPILLDQAIARRQRRFHEQLLDVLIMIKGAVQAGYSLMQALDMMAEQVNEPSASEYGRVLREVRFGIPLEQALLNLSERMESDDLQIVVTAIIINTRVGGNLSTVLEATISTIRDRLHLFGEIQSLTAYARYVGNFLSLMPFITGIAVFLINPEYFESVKTEFFTQAAFVLALISVIIGNILIRRMVRIRV
jgi:tight adherence protein B